MDDTAEAAYARYQTERQPYLDEAYRSAKLTIPSLFPDSQDIVHRTSASLSKLAKPFQSLGAQGVNNLASKLLLTLFPPTSPFLKYVLSEQLRADAERQGQDLSKIQAQLARREQRIQSEVDVRNIRSKVFQILRFLLVGGNVLTYYDSTKGGLQVYPLNAYCCKRDGMGNLVDLIYVERLTRSTAPQAVVEHLEMFPEVNAQFQPNDPIRLYTRVRRIEGDRFESYQEVGGIKLADSDDTHTLRDLPWLVLRYTAIDGEDYGRGFIEEYRGNLTSFEQLSRDAQFASANAAKVIWGINPASVLKPKKFLEAENGTAVSAGPEDVNAIRLDKGGDMQIASIQLERLERALSQAFLIYASIQRNQERVTAEEIRRLAEELDDTLGGVFSLFSQELQLPLARLVEADLEKNDPDFRPLPEGQVRIGVVTGLAAIGRGQDLMRLREGLAMLGDVAAFLPGIQDYVIEGDVNRRIWTGSGVDTEGLVRTDEEVEELRAQRQQAQSASMLGGEMAKGAGKVVGSGDEQKIAQMAQIAQQAQAAA